MTVGRRVLLVAVVGWWLLAAVGGAQAAAQEPTPALPPAEETGTDGAAAADPCGDQQTLYDRALCRAGETAGQAVGRVVRSAARSSLEWLAAGMADAAAWTLGRLVTLIDSTTRPDVTAAWFGGQYARTASLAAVLVVPLLLLATISAVVRSDWRELLRSYFVYLPAAMFFTAVAIPLVDLAVGVTDGMSAFALAPVRADAEAFLLGPVTQALTTSDGIGATVTGIVPALALVVALLILLGAVAVWVELVVRSAGIYVAVFLLPLGFAALVWPATRRWFARLVKLLVALALLKPIIAGVVGLAAAALGGMQLAGADALVAGGALMLFAAFAPVLLLEIVDVVGDHTAAAVASVTERRTSPVPVPTGRPTGAAMVRRIMSDQLSRERMIGDWGQWPTGDWLPGPVSGQGSASAADAGGDGQAAGASGGMGGSVSATAGGGAGAALGAAAAAGGTAKASGQRVGGHVAKAAEPGDSGTRPPAAPRQPPPADEPSSPPPRRPPPPTEE